MPPKIHNNNFIFQGIYHTAGLNGSIYTQLLNFYDEKNQQNPQINPFIKSSYPSVSSVDAFNTLRPRQDGRHFPDDIFKCIFLNENVWISLTISLKCVRKVRINDIPLSEPMMISLLTHICVTRPQWVKKTRNLWKLGFIQDSACYLFNTLCMYLFCV